jgi:hypothetical protein
VEVPVVRIGRGGLGRARQWRLLVASAACRARERKEVGTEHAKFDIVAACLFNQTVRWEYLFTRTIDLTRHSKNDACLNTMQRVPPVPKDSWKGTLQEVLALFSGKKK